ncbi:DUF4153 domain-containing protein [Roseovarius sp. MMSF_3281]|uniref:DUF4153 domain-containing protein n=1 Tax=Roseovarius sp. MMSF_3281 TaxID=3046694 RepID=UPI00273E04C8|nr:DUF4173 domain-containing protein [Roseovarius sp. MMSF_3281]
MKSFLVRGVPASIQTDSWWMDGITRHLPPPRADGARGPGRLERIGALAALILLADMLLWGVDAGLSLALFGAMLLFAGLAMRDGKGWGGFILGAFLMLPLVEQVQVLSILFWWIGLLMGAAWIGLGGWPGLAGAIRGALRLIWLGPWQTANDLWNGLSMTGGPSTGTLSKAVLGWALPLGMSLIFLSLLIEANPVFEDWAVGLSNVELPDLSRVSFWAGIAVLIWPVLNLAEFQERLRPPGRVDRHGPRRLPRWLNPEAVRRSVILFNLIFAVQTVMDLTYLWGGVALPEGVGHAQYAHRGAYSLLVTALLAGGFAIVARPFAEADRWLRAALLFWVAQTVWLVISSMLRLELYVGVYGLTRLRLSAAIWMGLVAVLLALVLWQIVARKPAGWLVLRGMALSAGVLYLSLFLSFDRAIAHYNLTHEVRKDAYYVCRLGPAALPEIRAYGRRTGHNLCKQFNFPEPRQIGSGDWREWGFRDWRVLRRLEKLETSAPGA